MPPNRNRRRWISSLAASAAIASLVSPLTAAGTRERAQDKKQIKPPPLKRGDLIGLFNPSGFADDALIQRATVNLETLGFRVMHAAHLRASRGNTAGTIGQRLP